ncbi:amino acid adenylation domain-containing protein [Bacillus atrophaeus]|uniref:non-ribosomal peptide synthetase n=2 Tax=Bacillus atrophaeus TaxID=1452 RepID=UPI0022802923|nr:non-ribosomal peptide synthetase [Bacillus atrophaeus]MCY8935163.1 amino acid adenylation domain-containing protein [Bacillus atrophaeus]
MLRTHFLVEDGEVYQKVAAEIEAKVEYDEIEYANEEDKKRLLMEFIRPFDLETAPLFRIKVIKVHQGADLLFFDMHHIISDGLSTNIIIEDFKTLYSGKILTPLRIQYKDYSEWIRSRDLTDQREYWHNEFKDVPSSLELPLDYPRPQFQSFRGHTVECTIEPEIKENIIKLCKQTGTTEYMVLLSAFMVLLREYSHQEDIVVGSPFSGRVHPDTEKILGMFVNTLVMRGKPQGDKSFHTFLEEMKEKCLQAQANQEYALEELIENLDLVRDSSRNPLYDIVFSFQNIDEVSLEGEGLRFKDIGIERNISKFDITMTVEALQKGYGLSFEYCSDLFSENSIDQMMVHYVQILKEITQNPTRKIIDINVVSPTEKEKILDEFNTISLSTPLDKNIVTRFEDQVAQIPDKVAVCADGKEITYQELNVKANELAVRLREMGIGRDDYVAIMAERNIETIIGICGIIKAGGAYVPVDPAYPLERVAYMLEDCKPKAILVNGSSYAYKGDIPIVDVSEAMRWTGRQENPVNINTVNDLIYLIYTSGTTGKPKGVMIEHKGVTRLVHRPNYVKLNKDTVILQTGSLSFDAATFEIWGALLNGGELHISSQDLIMDASALKCVIEGQKITMMWLTVTLFNQLVNEDVTVFNQLKTLIFGGEKVSEVHIRKFKKENKKTQLINGYGPTETTTFATYYPIDADQVKVKTPIGKPISNTTTYIMNEGRLCGIGMAGELCIAGDGVARGYLNNPELTKAKFIPNPYGSGMMYCSGDLVKWLQDGNIEYLGRIDDQVKLRGFRIELGEIESVIRQIKDIRDTALIISEKEQEKSICAYLVGEKVLDIKAIRQELSKHLPAYMIPSHMMQIECIPVTRNGKLNKKALPKIEVNSEETYVAPRNQTEEEIVSIFSGILGINNLGVTDSFYDMGGDSIKAIRVVSKLREANYSVSMREIIQFQTVENVAKVIRRVEEKEESRQEEISGEVPLTPIQDTFFKWKLNNPNHFNQSVLLANPEGFNEEAVKQSLLAIVKHHDILRAIFKDGKQEILSIKHCEKPELRIYDFSELKDEKLSKAIEVKNDELQKSINLATGPLVKCALFKTTNGDHLMIAIHHLVVDGVSWRIILEDFESSYKQYIKTKEIELPKKTTSYQEWSNELFKYGSSSELQKEVSYWNGVLENANFGETDADMDGADIGSGRISFEIDARKTSKLVHLGKVYNAEFQEILLASLARANELWQRHKKLTLFLEGHGREEFSNNLKIDRTVGWFTTIYPITIEALDTLENSIVKTKEILKTVPNSGIGYGIIQHQQGEKISNINIDISFNFLGELSRGKSRFIKSPFPTGTQIAEENIISNLIINSIIDEGKLKLDIFYNKGKYSEYIIQQLKNCYEKTLLEAIEHTNNLAVNGKVEQENFESSFKQSKVIEEEKNLQVTTDNIFALKQYDISSFEKTLFSKELLEYEKNIVDKKAECFEPFAYQKFFFNNYPDNVCGAKTEIQGDITQERLISIVKDIVCEQSIFRLSYDKDRNQLQQYSYTSDWHIPFIDISSNKQLGQDLEWCDAVIQASQLFKEQRLLSKIFIVKIDPNRYCLYFFVHHGLWDLASTEILGQLIKDKISRKQENLISNYYTEYTKIRNEIENKNQLQPDAKDFVDNFFKQASIYDSLMKGKTAQRCIHIKYKYNESVLNQILKDPILWVTELYDLLNIQPNIHSKSSFPFLLMHFGREDMGFQTLGLHLDIIPYQYDGVTHSIKRLGKQQVHNNYGHLLFESKGDDSERRNKYFKHIPVVNFYADMEIDNIFDSFNHYEMELKDMVAGNEITLRIFKEILYVAVPIINNDMDSAFKIASEYLGLK